MEHKVHTFDLRTTPWYCVVIKVREGIRVDIPCEGRRFSMSTLSEGFVIRTKEDVEGIIGTSWDLLPDVSFYPEEIRRPAAYHYRAPPLQYIGRAHRVVDGLLHPVDSAEGRVWRDTSINRTVYFAVTPDPFRSAYAVVLQMSKTKQYDNRGIGAKSPFPTTADLFEIRTPIGTDLKIKDCPVEVFTETASSPLQIYCSTFSFWRIVEGASHYEESRKGRGITFEPEVRSKRPRVEPGDSDTEMDVPTAIENLKTAIDHERTRTIESLGHEQSETLRRARDLEDTRAKLLAAEARVQDLTRELIAERAATHKLKNALDIARTYIASSLPQSSQKQEPSGRRTEV